MILMNDFKAEPPELREAMLAAARRVLESGWYVLGKEVEAFEKEWAAACATSHAVGVGNGMDAIEIALRALDIGPGDTAGHRLNGLALARAPRPYWRTSIPGRHCCRWKAPSAAFRRVPGRYCWCTFMARSRGWMHGRLSAANMALPW